MLEKHYTVQEIAAAWNVSEETVRRFFRDEPGVMHIGKPTSSAGRKYKRRYFVLRIPESVMEKVRARLLQQGRCGAS
jgi:predicted transcriptional regulator